MDGVQTLMDLIQSKYFAIIYNLKNACNHSEPFGRNSLKGQMLLVCGDGVRVERYPTSILINYEKNIINNTKSLECESGYLSRQFDPFSPTTGSFSNDQERSVIILLVVWTDGKSSEIISNSKTYLDIFRMGMELDHLKCLFKEGEKGKIIDFVKKCSWSSILFKENKNKDISESYWIVIVDLILIFKSKFLFGETETFKNKGSKISRMEWGVQIELFYF
jgi:hypothetical protein